MRTVRLQRTATSLEVGCGGCTWRGGAGGRTARAARASTESALVVVDIIVCGRNDRGETL